MFVPVYNNYANHVSKAKQVEMFDFSKNVDQQHNEVNEVGVVANKKGKKESQSVFAYLLNLTSRLFWENYDMFLPQITSNLDGHPIVAASFGVLTYMIWLLMLGFFSIQGYSGNFRC